MRAALVCALFAAPACTGSGSPAGQRIIPVELRDFAIGAGSNAIPAGTVTFDISNEGPAPHEFVIVETDMTPEELPVAFGVVDEDAQGLTAVDEKEDIKAGSSATLKVDLSPGTYLFFCNLPGHYLFGMHTTFTVT